MQHSTVCKKIRPADALILKDRTDLRHFGSANFSDTAALVAHLDLVISVDTSIVHLAGALVARVGQRHYARSCCAARFSTKLFVSAFIAAIRSRILRLAKSAKPTSFP
jgi:hypothetical protein